jgi:hypothetical protein
MSYVAPIVVANGAAINGRLKHELFVEYSTPSTRLSWSAPKMRSCAAEIQRARKQIRDDSCPVPRSRRPCSSR